MELAKSSTCHQQHGAILVAGGRTISSGINSIRNHPAMPGIPSNDYSIHAEVAALRAAPKGMNLKNATMYVARVYRSGKPAMSAPCAPCRLTLKAAGIRKVVYTIDKEMTL